MADINDLAQRLAFYQAGGKDPGTSTLDKINSSVGVIDTAIKDVLAIKKAKLENKKLAREEAPIGASFGILSAKDEAAKNQLIASKNTTRVPENIYPQPNAELESGGLPANVYGPLQQPPSQTIPTSDPMLNGRADFQRNTGISPDTKMGDVPEIIKIAMLQGQQPVFYNDTTYQWSLDPRSQLQGYRPLTKVKGSQAATMVAGKANATMPMPTITEAEALSKTQAGAPPTKATRIVQGTTANLDSRADVLADAIMHNAIPPDVTKLAGGRGGLGGMVLQKLAEKGFNYRDANLEWQQALAGSVGLSKSLNSTQMVQLQTAFNTVAQDIQPMRDISAELDRTGFTPANKLIISARLHGVEFTPGILDGLDQAQVQAATKYITQINLMRDNMAVAFMRGGVPTDQAFKLTESILNPVYSDPQINSALDQVEKNLQYREHALNDVTVRSPGHGGNTAPPPPTNTEAIKASIRAKMLRQ